MSVKPVIAITMGDPAGVGPELCLKAAASPAVARLCTPLIVGDAVLLHNVASTLDLPVPSHILTLPRWRTDTSSVSRATILDCAALGNTRVEPGKIQAICGRASYEYVLEAIRAASQGRVAAIATAPINKEALHRAGVPYPGHTEILAAKTRTRRFCMMLTTDQLAVSLVTVHVPYTRVPGLLTKRGILDVIELTADALRRCGRSNPRLTVCGLNPHAGEHGLFGDEEGRIIEPAVAAARRNGLRVEGPLPPDTAFIPAWRRKTDAYIAMYHDQGLIPFKMLGFDEGVNITLGLPIIRTSVDHGTAYDLAWKGRASASSLVAAIRWAARLATPAGAGGGA
jgi:4-hydroxythreonine-4-phosphate dehydrogenase